MRRQRGAALLLVLFGLMLLAGLTIAFATTTRTSLVQSRNLGEQARARHLAEAALWATLHAVETGALDLRPDADGVVRHAVTFDGAAIAVALVPENARVDLNQAGESLVATALRAAGASAAEAGREAARILDWRDRDDAQRPEGAEAAAYRRAGLDHAPRNDGFAAVDEVRRVLGLGEVRFRALAPLVTVHGFSDALDPMTAPPSLLAALPAADPIALQALLAARVARAAGESNVPVPVVPGAEALLAPGPNLAWTVRIEVGGEAAVRFRREAVVWFGSDGDLPFRVIEWRAPGYGLGGRPMRTDAAALAQPPGR